MLGGVQRALILKGFSGFAGLKAEQLALLASICREKHYSAGALLHEPGKPVTSFHLVIDGEVEMYRDGQPYRVLTGRSTVGGLASLARDPRGAHAVAKTDVFALMMDGDDMDEVFEDNFSIIYAVMRGLGNALREAQMQAGGGAAIDTNKRIDRIDASRKLSLVDRMFILSKATNFADVSVEALAQMARDVEEMRVPAGTEIWGEGQPARYSMLLVDGVVECSAEGRESFKFGPSFYVGSLDPLTQNPRWYGCRAETDVVALKIRTDRFLDMLEDHTDMALEMLRNFARGVTALIERRIAAMNEEEEAA
jgi:CRP-like cAMP-binding protein